MQIKTLLIFFCCFGSIAMASLSYQVRINGAPNSAILDDIKGVSELEQLKSHPPRSVNALKFRAAADLPAIINVLHSYGYYDADVQFHIENIKTTILVQLHILPGPCYKISAFEILTSSADQKSCLEGCSFIEPEKLGITIGEPAKFWTIIHAEQELLMGLGQCGYPLASIEKRKVLADAKKHEVSVYLIVNPGPKAYFGATTIAGLTSISPLFIEKKIGWEEGEAYSPQQIRQTQERLLKSDLFASVLITHGPTLNDQGAIPIKIHLQESKHKNIAFGVTYATIDGPGGTFQWTNRNMHDEGELLSVNLDYSKKLLLGTITYKKPDFIKLGQDFVSQIQAMQEKIHAYLAEDYSIFARVDYKSSATTSGSCGGKYEHLIVRKSARNGTYDLVSIPIYAKYNTSNSFLNPTRGFTIVFRSTPYLSAGAHRSFFARQTLLGNFYLPIAKKDAVVFALRAQIGSLVGPSIRKLPLPKTFLGGSDDDLRGYRYHTVGPRNKNGDAIGGRSAIYISFEPRFRITKNIGIVPFTDLGVVTRRMYPNPCGKWYKSVGIGLRYFTFFGPMRFDIGFPLNRRKAVDPLFRFYASMGQAF